MSMSVQEATEQEKKLIGNFPNTYTFTKNLAEKNLKANRGHLRTIIHRPAIIACCDKQPFPGWTDSISAAGGLTVLGGLGILKLLPTPGLNVFDVIPADIVSNSILVCCAHNVINNIDFDVFNCGSSVTNPISIHDYAVTICDLAQSDTFKETIGVPEITTVPNPTKYEILKNLTERWPIALLDKALDLPFVNQPALQKQVKQLQKIQNKLDGMTDLFRFFFGNQWLYKSQKLLDVQDKMSADEKEEFYCDMRNMDWREYLRKYLLGLQIWVLKENSIAPRYQMRQ